MMELKETKQSLRILKIYSWSKARIVSTNSMALDSLLIIASMSMSLILC